MPQGSVLGPFLYILFIIDLTQDVRNVKVACFADDTKDWDKTTLGEALFQKDLDAMYHWAVMNNSEFNGKKFLRMVFGTSDEKGAKQSVLLQPGGQPIKTVHQARDLGIQMSDDATFDVHINNVVQGAQTLSAWALRTFKTRETGPMLVLYKGLVRSKTEYASVLWSPTKAHNIGKLESVQRRFTSKFAMFRRFNEDTGFTECHCDYWERLQRLKLLSLERRRERYTILYMVKIHLSIVPDLGILSTVQNRTQTKYLHKYNKKAPTAARSLRAASFFYLGPTLYNLLPEDLRTPAPLTMTDEDKKALQARLKHRIDKWLELIPDEPTAGRLQRAASKNTLQSQLALHGRDVARKWKIVKAKLDKEEAEAEAAKQAAEAKQNNTRP